MNITRGNLVTVRAQLSAREPPICADIGSVPVKARCTQIRVFCVPVESAAMFGLLLRRQQRAEAAAGIGARRRIEPGQGVLPASLGDALCAFSRDLIQAVKGFDGVDDCLNAARRQICSGVCAAGCARRELDAGDNDRVWFWRGVVAALEGCGLCRTAAALAGRTGGRWFMSHGTPMMGGASLDHWLLHARQRM